MTQNYLKKEFRVITRKEKLLSNLYLQLSSAIFFSAKILHRNSSGNGNTAFKNIAWRRLWSWTLAISSPFSSDLGKFKLETKIKTLKNIVDKKQVGIKEAIKIIPSLYASRKLLVSEVLKLIKLILLVSTTNAVSERSP